MNETVPQLRRLRVRVIGHRLVALATEALPGSVIEVQEPDSLTAPESKTFLPELVLIDADAAGSEMLGAGIAALAGCRPQPAVIVAGAKLPTSLVRALLKLEQSDVLEAPFAVANLARIAATLTAVAPVSDASGSRCWSVMGAVGGSGSTTVAIETAAALAADQRGGRRVCLVDLNLADGAAAAYLGSSANMLLVEAASAPERIDASVLQAYSAPNSAGFDLLACPRDPQAFFKVRAEVVCRVLEVACQVYDSVVIDLPRHRQSWTLDVLSGSDEVLVVSELTVPALLSARAFAAELEADLAGCRPRLVVNRLTSKVFGPAPSLAEAEKALQRKADAGIVSDWEAAAASVNLGGSIRQQRPKSRIVKDVERMVDMLLALEVQLPAGERAA
jgi:pilus assembly protein CpaE